MSIFTKSLKTFKSDITGKEESYKINVAIQAKLESMYNLTLADLNGEDVSDLELSKFVHAVMLANDKEVTLEEIVDHVASFDLFEFMTNYNLVNNENFTLATERLKAKTEAKLKQAEKNKN